MNGANLSQGKPATVSSIENSSYPASNAVDGNSSTRWSSQFSDPQWLQVDLGTGGTKTLTGFTGAGRYVRMYGTGSVSIPHGTGACQIRASD
ncbi:hypothetical protein ABIA35_003525 [Catenulispora sp. MAP12-49]|uniref:discoidin domain-containing protein n=1 Tax=Catenulispora sp. MAP12-49 TaxID=3156302 RepID=UPI003511DD59